MGRSRAPRDGKDARRTGLEGFLAVDWSDAGLPGCGRIGAAATDADTRESP